MRPAFARSSAALYVTISALWAAVSPASAQLPPPAEPVPVWESELSAYDRAVYERDVEALVARFEAETGTRITPGEKGRVGLKVYTDSGPGLATPVPLVQGVIAALQRRGFKKEDIFLVGLNQLRLRVTGYLPSLVGARTPFEGHPVYVLESGRYYDPVWFYDSPLPSRFDPVFAEQQVAGIEGETSLEQDRKSFLATPLFLEADFWINLPVYTDHPVLGVNGALVNATLWNASNTARFFRSPANAPAAVAEMSAIRWRWIRSCSSASTSGADGRGFSRCPMRFARWSSRRSSAWARPARSRSGSLRCSPESRVSAKFPLSPRRACVLFYGA
jgi:hypothetical protein